jgi:hypothetical protein
MLLRIAEPGIMAGHGFRVEGTAPMPWYRLYHLDPHSGHIERAEDLFGADDVAAIYELQQRGTQHPLELWESGRKVVHLDAVPEIAARAAPYPVDSE